MRITRSVLLSAVALSLTLGSVPAAAQGFHGGGGHGGGFGAHGGGFGGHGYTGGGAYRAGGYGGGYYHGGYGGYYRGGYGYRGYGYGYRPYYAGYYGGFGYPGYYGYYGGGFGAFGGFLLGAAVVGGIAAASANDGAYDSGGDYDAHYTTQAPAYQAGYTDPGRVGAGSDAVATCAGMARDRAGGGQVSSASITGTAGNQTVVQGRVGNSGFTCSVTPSGQVTQFDFAR